MPLAVRLVHVLHLRYIPARRNHEHSGSDQARREKARKAVRQVAASVGHSAEREVIKLKRRTLSAAGRAAIIKAAKKRWAKVRKQAKRAVS